jgi:hypothetical protein
MLTRRVPGNCPGWDVLQGQPGLWGMGVSIILKVAWNLAKNPTPGSNGRLYDFQ